MYCNNYKSYDSPQIIQTAYMCFFVQYDQFNISVIVRDRQNDIQKAEAASLIKKVFGGSRKALFSALLEDEPLSEEEINVLRKLIDNR